jgi:hypothetical protein
MDVPDDRLERVGVDVGAQFVALEALRPLDGGGENLQVGVGPGRDVIADRVDAFRLGLSLVLCKKLHRSRELKLRREANRRS